MRVALRFHMAAAVQNHIVVREVGTPWTEHIADEGAGSDKTVVLLQQGDESPEDLEARLTHRVQNIEKQREWVRSAVIACNEQCDPKTLKTRYRIARRVLKHMHKPGPGRLTLVLDKAGGKRALKALVTMCKKLLREVAPANVALTIQCGAEMISLLGPENPDGLLVA
jgi:hypothetical protein